MQVAQRRRFSIQSRAIDRAQVGCMQSGSVACNRMERDAMRCNLLGQSISDWLGWTAGRDAARGAHQLI